MKRSFLLSLALAVGCEDPEASRAALDFEEARSEYPDALSLQASLLTETCSPNPGVCHNGREYPELHTFTSLAELVDAPCNIAPPSPELGWDACERPPYWLQLEDFATPIAWTEALAPARWAVTVAHPIPAELIPTAPIEEDAGESFQILDPRGAVALAPARDWITDLEASSGRTTITFTFTAPSPRDIAPTVDSIMRGVVGGDPNYNGVWGASAPEEERARMIVPGSRERSYLWRRILGDVPGDPMPIANGPVTNAQMLALGCWIEGARGAADPHGMIDYSGCSFADDPPLFFDAEPELDSD